MRKILTLLLCALSACGAAAQGDAMQDTALSDAAQGDVTTPTLPPIPTAMQTNPHLNSLGMKVFAGDELLDKAEVKSLLVGTPGYDLYLRALRKRTTGAVLLGVGSGIAGMGVTVGFIAVIFHSMGSDAGGSRGTYWRSGGAVAFGLFLAGGGAIAGGVVLLRTCKHGVTRAVDAYNSKLDRAAGGELAFGFTPGGVGLSYSF